jgi:murein L,D-transpeptidase YafK
MLKEQMEYERVRVAFSEKSKIVLANLKKNNIKAEELNLLFVAFKTEKKLMIYAKKESENVYKSFLVYPICKSSGELGPKRKSGDYQVPEGFYYIDRFNPKSNFYVSLGINYPNESDKKKSQAENLGGDIFIHGSCVTVGCLPMTDENMKEIYIYALLAKQNGQSKIPVYIFPFEMTEKNIEIYENKYQNKTALLKFWQRLKIGFDLFEKNKKELKITVDGNGNYEFL